MMAGHFSGNHVSSGDLNRSPESRGSQPSGVLPVLFVQAKRINSFSFQRTSRFYKPRFSSPQWRLCTNKIKTIPKRDSRFCKPRFSSPQWRLRTNKIKTFENFYILFVSHKKYDKNALPCRERFEVLQTSNQHTKLQLRTNPIKSFCRSACLFGLLFVPKSRPKRASNRRFDALFFIQSKALAPQAFG